MAGLQQRDQLSRATGPAIERVWKFRELLVSPCCSDTESGMDEEERCSAKGRKEFERLNFFSAASGESRFVLQEKGNVRTERGRDGVQFNDRERMAKDFVQPQ